MRRSYLIVIAILLLLLASCVAIYSLYRSDMRQAYAAVAEGSLIAETAAGPVEYADRGEGPPLLSIHGAGGGFDQGLANAAGLVGSGFRVVAPSRFGYLRTPLGEDVSAVAQADAHAALLDALGIDKAVVLGASAGTRSALQLAIRHPDRVSALILTVPATWHPQAAAAETLRGLDYPILLSLVNSGADFVWWTALRVAPSLLVRFIGVPPEVLDTALPADRRAVMAMVRSVMPLSARFRGIAMDSVPDTTELRAGAVTVPTLIVTARDDLFDTLPSAQYVADMIDGARLVVYETGGHLLVGHRERTHEAVRSLLAGAGVFSGQDEPQPRQR